MEIQKQKFKRYRKFYKIYKHFCYAQNILKLKKNYRIIDSYMRYLKSLRNYVLMIKRLRKQFQLHIPFRFQSNLKTKKNNFLSKHDNTKKYKSNRFTNKNSLKKSNYKKKITNKNYN